MNNKPKKSLRPDNFDEYIGQEKITSQLKVIAKAAKFRQNRAEQQNEDPDVTINQIDHIIFDGEAGLGKTSLAFVMASEVGSSIKIMQGNSIEKLGDLASVLMTIEKNDFLFIDEIHTLNQNIEDLLLSVLEDFRFDIIIDDAGNPLGKPISLDIPPFTLIGATTELGRLKKPFAERFTHTYTLKPYSTEELQMIIGLNSLTMEVEINDRAKEMIAKASRGVPRVAISLLKKCRDYSQVFSDSVITEDTVELAFKESDVTESGMKLNDMDYLKKLKKHMDRTNGRAVGLKVLTNITGIHPRTIEDSIEPHLIRHGFIIKTHSGRIISELGLELLKNEQD